METITRNQITCPSWCVVDHDAEYRQERDGFAEHGHPHPGPDPDPLHRGADFLCGRWNDADQHAGVYVRLVQDQGKVRVAIGDDCELTPDFAQQLAAVLPVLVAQARG